MSQRRDREIPEPNVLPIPDLWAPNLEGITRAITKTTEAVAARAGRDAAALRVRTPVGAFYGALVPVWLAWAADPRLDLAAEVDTALAQLEGGCRL